MTKPKAAIPAWIIRERKRMGLKPPDIAERMTAMGYPVVTGTVRTWEAGRNPSPSNIEGLERLFGSQAPGDRPEGSGYGLDLSGLFARLDAQAVAITELAAQVKALAAVQSPVTTAHLVAEAVDGALRVTLPSVLRAAGLPPT